MTALAQPPAGTEPTRRAGRGFVAALTGANLGLCVAWFGPLQLLLAKQAAQLTPHHKTSTLALVTGLGAAAALIANPVFGALSDRTVARVGRRIPWVAFGLAVAAAGLAVLARAPSAPVMAIGWCVVQIGSNAAYAALTAAVPDQVPTRQRGTVGAGIGVAAIVGVLIGTGLATVAGGLTTGYLACALFSVIAGVPYLLMRRDLRLDRAQRPPFQWRRFLAGFWRSPRRYPDFGWAWLTRFLINLGNSICTMYLLYYLTDTVHYRGDADTGVLILTALDALTILIAALIGGIWSDRTGERKAFVVWAGIIMTAATVLFATIQTWPGAIAAALILGIGYGVYTSVDFALITDVLPTAEDHGRDLGVINIAGAAPQVLAPAIAAPIVAATGGYTTLYLAAAAICLAGSLLVRRIRSVP
ncbi:MFS transporter [Spirillospora sp. NPDC052269]